MLKIVGNLNKSMINFDPRVLRFCFDNITYKESDLIKYIKNIMMNFA